MSLPTSVENHQVLIRVLSDIRPPIWRPRRGVLCSDPERGEQRTVMDANHFICSRGGKVVILSLKQAYGVMEQGA